MCTLTKHKNVQSLYAVITFGEVKHVYIQALWKMTDTKNNVLLYFYFFAKINCLPVIC